MKGLRNEWRCRCDQEREYRTQVFGCSSDVVTEEPQDLASFLDGIEHRAAQNRAHWMQLVLEGCHDAKVAPATTHTPEEVLVLVGAGSDELSISRYDVHRNQVITRQTALAREIAEATA